ncbi:beta family protein [Streptomyces xanthophaeus]|uniref:beta family protein n=1 Tax=Streptomyces xanthophaeus TaxID=67385 RepID=UPI002647D9DA|nr:beta family protein [Streptomyces xanthophaeus]WKD32082.1 beta family protein [Streptomyces xanthophaeus]
MSGPLYVPVLPTRPHAAAAYEQLSPAIQAAVMPLWNLPPRPGLPEELLIAHTRREAHTASRVQRHRPGWLDAPFADETQLAVLADVMSDLGELSPLRPVTGPGRPEFHQTAALETARRSGSGVGIRVTLAGEWDDDSAHTVRDLLARVDPAVETDLLLDLGTVRADRPDAGKEALRALDALMPLTPWRTAAALSGGFPEVTADMLEQGLRPEPRADWHVWRELTDGDRRYVPWLSYGDYGIQPARMIGREPSSGRGGPAWGVLRYTTEESFVLAKVLARGEDRTAVNRAAARQLLELPDFRGATASAGESWLRDCARGHGSAGTGNAAVWLRVGNVQHMTYIVRSLGA